MNMQIMLRDLVYSAENMRSRSMEHRNDSGIRDYKNLGKMPEGLYHEIR